MERYNSEIELQAYLLRINPIFLLTHSLNLTEQRIWNVLLFFAHDTLLTNEYHKISIATLSHLLSIKNHASITKSLRSLKRYNNRDKKLFQFYLEDITINQKTITYKYPKHIASVCSHKFVGEITTKIIKTKLSSKYSMLLYKFFLYWNLFGFMKTVSIASLKNYLNIKVEKYTTTKNFIDFILIRAIYEINEKTELTIKMKPIKRNAEIIGFNFNVVNSRPFDITSEELIQFFLYNLAFLRAHFLFSKVLTTTEFSIDTHVAPVEKEFMSTLILESRR